MKIHSMKPFFHPSNLCQLFIGTLFITACSTPQPVSRLVPLEPTNKWWHGREVMELPEERGVVMDVVFQKSTQQYLILDVRVQNFSDQPVLVDPLQFSMEGLMGDTMTSIAAPLKAFDPEMILLNLDKSASREIAEGQNSASLELLSLTLDAASDISSIGKDEDLQERAQEMEDREIRRADYEIEQSNRDYRLGSLAEQREYWEYETIRKTSLEPNYELKGSLFFPRQNEASFIHFKGVVEGRVFQVIFRQRLFKP